MVAVCTIRVCLDTKGTYEAHDDDRAFGRLVTAAWGLDVSWMQLGLCTDYPAAKEETGWTWWMADTCDNSKPIPKRDKLRAEKGAMALLVCRNCPVQYDCASYATKSLMAAGIWGVRTSNLQWLQKQAIDPIAGQGSGDPVEVYVTARRYQHIEEVARLSSRP